MNILHISPRYLPAIGGAEKHLHELSRRLVTDGHRVRVLTCDALDADYFWNPTRRRIESRVETIDGVRVQRFPLQHFPAPIWSYRGIRRGLAILSDLNAPVALLNRLAQFAPHAPELAHALSGGSESYDLVAGINIAYEGLLIPGYEFARRYKLPWLVFPLTHLGDSAHDTHVRKFYTMRHQLALIGAADAVFTETPHETRFLAASGLDPRRLIQLGSGVNPEELRGGDAATARSHFQLDGPVVLYLGTVSADKGALTLLAAMEKLWAQGKRDVTLVVAGNTLDEWDRAFNQAPRETRARVRVLGPVDEAEKNNLLAVCDLLALPSRVDSFGIVLLEAWLYAKPVIGAAAGGLPDVIADGRDGLLVPFGDADALARSIGQLLADPAAASEMGRQGCAKVLAQHTWESKYKTLREVYQRVVARQPLHDLAGGAG